MKLKIVACLFFLLNTFLFATYYSVSKEALGRIEPIVFSFCEMVTLLPAGICILIVSRKNLNRTVLKRGVLLGSWLCLALFTIAIALKYTTATSTAFFPSLNGLLAALIAWLTFRQPIGKVTWFAGLVSVIGAALLIANSTMGGWRGLLIAFLGGLFFTCYVFLADNQQADVAPWPLFGIELLTMAGWSMLIVLLFGDWQAVHPSLPKDIWVILYIAVMTTFLPTLITVLMQRYISPVTVSFIYILEPVIGALVANLYLHEMLPLLGYLGGCLVVVGTIIHTWCVSWQSSKVHSLQNVFTRIDEHIHRSFTSLLGYPILLLAISFILLYRYGGFPPAAWLELYHSWPYLPILIQQGSRPAVILLLVQATCWFIAWVTFGAMTLLTVNHIISSKLFDPKPATVRHLPQKPTHTSNLPPHIYENTNRTGEVHPRSYNKATHNHSPTHTLLDELVS
jgi:drug/metabolite transporter (DMT)-like permease